MARHCQVVRHHAGLKGARTMPVAAMPMAAFPTLPLAAAERPIDRAAPEFISEPVQTCRVVEQNPLIGCPCRRRRAARGRHAATHARLVTRHPGPPPPPPPP